MKALPSNLEQAHFGGSQWAHCCWQGRTYLCKRLDLSTKTAIVRPVDVKYYTSIREHQDIYVVGGAAAYPSPEVAPSFFQVCSQAVADCTRPALRFGLQHLDHAANNKGSNSL